MIKRRERTAARASGFRLDGRRAIGLSKKKMMKSTYIDEYVYEN